MNLSSEKMIESGTIDCSTLFSVVDEIKSTLKISPANDYSVLLFDSVYFVVDYDAHYSNHECPSRYNLLQNSDFVFRVTLNQVDILKSRINIDEVKKLFSSRQISINRTCSHTHVDEE